MKHLLKIGLTINITAFVAVMLFSCSNPDAVVMEMGSDDTLSGIIADSVVFYRSDSGIINLELHTPRMVRMETEADIMEFPLGFDVYMFDKGKKTKRFLMLFLPIMIVLAFAIFSIFGIL